MKKEKWIQAPQFINAKEKKFIPRRAAQGIRRPCFQSL